MKHTLILKNYLDNILDLIAAQKTVTTQSRYTSGKRLLLLQAQLLPMLVAVFTMHQMNY